MNSAKWQNKKSTCKNMLHLYTLTMNNLERILRNQFHVHNIKKNKILGSKFNQGGKDLDTKN